MAVVIINIFSQRKNSTYICRGDILMKKVSYIKCPRCELNYIKSTDRYCPVCMAELKLAGEVFEHFEDEDELDLCPICGQNFISPDQKCCEECAKGKEEDFEEDDELISKPDDDEEKAESWENDTENVQDDDVELVPLSELSEEDFDDDDEESEEEASDKASYSDEEDDLDLDNLDDLDDLDEDEDDEEDFEDDDEDDEDF